MTKKDTKTLDQLPEPDRGDLEITIDKLIKEEGKRGNKMQYDDLYVLYSRERYENLWNSYWSVVENADTTKMMDGTKQVQTPGWDKATDAKQGMVVYDEEMSDGDKKTINDWESDIIINPNKEWN